MGVKFKDIVNPEAIKFEDLKGKTVAIDAANIIYQFLSIIRQSDGTPLMDHRGKVTSHFSGILYRTTSLIEKEIKPFYVFDGAPSVLKKSTQMKRSEIKEESRKKWIEALKNGNIEDARKYAGRTSRMSKEIIDGSKKLLELMGIPFIQAIGEGEAQASYMVDKGDAWCVGSQDYDCILFGATRMVKNLTITGGKTNLELIELQKVLEEVKLSREQLIDVAILVGTDFNEGVKGIGAKKGINLIKKHGDVLKVLDDMKIEMEVDPEDLREIFLKHDFISDYELKWVNPDKEGIVEFLAGDHDFSEDRVINAINKLKKLDNSQSSLEKWF